MKVILLRDIKKLGKKFEVKEVSPGYARNLLIPNGYAILADKQSLKRLESQKNIEMKKAEERQKENEKMIKELEGKEIKIDTKIGDKGQLFETINEQKIADKLKEMGFAVEKSNIEINEPIKCQGEYLVKLKLDNNLEGKIKIII
ncbi:MAG TPA: 50S ribosomal protein L9 [Candidatus Paceibacterota bacterium]|jgi:large subunit ribosomal protein L9|nr:50S ribosomal protein L9 [Candidatus Pacearchaeota archaeon]HRT18079.1 50S ribosomal protein L9 [Candidatus Paceibacterota bacterium]